MNFKQKWDYAVEVYEKAVASFEQNPTSAAAEQMTRAWEEANDLRIEIRKLLK